MIRSQTFPSATPALPRQRPALAEGNRHRAELATPLPRISHRLLQFFSRYCRWYLGRHFHSLRVSHAGLPPAITDLPLVMFINHPSWWDPIVGLVLKAALFPDQALFAPIDATALERYGLFRRLGFFGVEQHTARGARQFLRTAQAVLQHPQTILAVTAQGRFADVRERPVQLQPGLGHLAARVPEALFVPVAMEYVFWEERLPEILVFFGKPILVHHGIHPPLTPSEWTGRFGEGLATAQETLASQAQRRAPDDFQILLRGSCGQGGVYDSWRWLKARLGGKTFIREHSSIAESAGYLNRAPSPIRWERDGERDSGSGIRRTLE